MTKAQSFLFRNNDDSNGEIIERCKCLSGSSIIISVLGSQVSTSAAISNAFLSPSESSAILYKGLPFFEANNCSSLPSEISIGMFDISSNSLIPWIGA